MPQPKVEVWSNSLPINLKTMVIYIDNPQLKTKKAKLILLTTHDLGKPFTISQT